MNKEREYTNSVGTNHIKSHGQYFTNYSIADFMCEWACQGAKSFLDPAVGNGIFMKLAAEKNPEYQINGFEVDEKIYDYFKLNDLNIIKKDYLLNDWSSKYDAIVCNPPYNRFQAVSNRNEVLAMFQDNLGVKYSGYTNLYILFLIKSIYQMSENGRLAYIIPSEFLNSKYGEAIKNILVQQKLIRAIINFQNNDEVFYNATTTCCILLLDKEKKEVVRFFNLKSVEDIVGLNVDADNTEVVIKEYKDLNPEQKWRTFLNHEEPEEYNNLVSVSTFCSVTRGIATGANDYFCFSPSKARENNIPFHLLTKCITKSADVKSLIFTDTEYESLVAKDKQVYILDAKEQDREQIINYITKGEAEGIDKKYLPSCRKPWFSMEQKGIAPIWVCPANRNSVKFVRNLSGIKTLTTFHSVMISTLFESYTDLIFCYFITPIAQKILRENRKELGNGLEKFQPNDLNFAYMLDVTKIEENDVEEVNGLFECIKNKPTDRCETEIGILNSIFEKYIK